MTSLWNRLRITHRFIAVLAAFVVSVLAVSGIGLWGMGAAKNSIQVLHEEALVRALLAGQAIEQAADSRMQVLLAFQHDPQGSLVSIHDHPAEQHLETVATNEAWVDQLFGLLSQGVTKQDEKDLLDAIAQARTAWGADLKRAVEAVHQNDYSPEVMADFLAAGRTNGETVLQTLAALRAYQMEAGDSAFKQAEQKYQLALWIFLGAGLLLVVPSVVLALWLLARLAKGFATADVALKLIAGSDLSHPVAHDGTDEIGNMLLHMETMRSNLSNAVGQVKSGAGAIASASAQVAAGTLDLSSRTEQQASALEETASATEELSSTVQQNADNAVQANQLAGEARHVAQSGGDIVGQMVGTMAEINQSAKKIVDIISVIDGIAFQTNILALNAAVEAARAGEQGRGFAVVAGEVRSLAQRSAAAAREVQALITDAVAKAETGNIQAAQAGTAMQEIVGGIQRVASIVDEIALASREQASGLAQINQAVGHLDGVTQQNAALVEESSAAASALQEQARSLAAMAETFRLEDQTAGGSSYLALQ